LKRCNTKGFKKVESSTLKEGGEEKARGALHPKRKSEKKGKFRPFFAFYFFYVFFFSLL
jgi:hypothetical protein